MAGGPTIGSTSAVKSTTRHVFRIRSRLPVRACLPHLVLEDVSTHCTVVAAGNNRCRIDWPQLRDEIVTSTAKVGDQLRARLRR